MADSDYKTLTVRDLIDIVSTDKRRFPKGLDTPIVTGDFEGNYRQIMHENFRCYKVGKNSALLLFHESRGDNGNV